MWIGLASPAELLITDSQGRRLGHNPTTGETFNEIPGGTYSCDGINNPLSDAETAHCEKVLYIQNPEDDVFSLQVIGTGAGDYDLTVSTNGSYDNHEWGHTASATTAGEIDSYVIDVPQRDSSARAVERLRELAEAKQADQPVVAAQLFSIADRLESGNYVATGLPVPVSEL